MPSRAAAPSRIVGEWTTASLPCPRCGGASEMRRSVPRQVGLPWANEPGDVVEWRCVRGLEECTGPTAEETRGVAARLAADRARPLSPAAERVAAAGQTWTCRSCGAVWGRALLRCPIDEGAIVPTETLRRSA